MLLACVLVLAACQASLPATTPAATKSVKTNEASSSPSASGVCPIGDETCASSSPVASYDAYDASISPESSPQSTTGVSGTSFIFPSSGSAPLRITLSVPTEWRDFVTLSCKGAGNPRLGGRAFSVDWDDGRTFPRYDGTQDSECGLSHTYTAPGTYNIKAMIYDFNDTPTFNGKFSQELWSDNATVVVTGVGPTRSLNLTYPVGGETFGYEEFPQIKWNITSDKKYDLLIELVAQDGTIIGSDTIRGVAFSGSGQSRPQPRSFDAYNAALSKGNTQFFARLSLIDNGARIEVKTGDKVKKNQTIATLDSDIQKIEENEAEAALGMAQGGVARPSLMDSGAAVLVRKSSLFTMNGNYSGTTMGGASPLAGVAPLTVTYNRKVAEQVCLSYKLDWGDGTAPLVVRGPMQGSTESCQAVHPAQKNLTFTHTYITPGTYTITWQSNDGYPSLSLEESWGMGVPDSETVYVGQK